MELLDGHLHVHLDLGSGPVKLRASRYPLNDGRWHRVEMTLKRRIGRVSVDGEPEAFETPGEYWTLHFKAEITLAPSGAADDKGRNEKVYKSPRASARSPCAVRWRQEERIKRLESDSIARTAARQSPTPAPQPFASFGASFSRGCRRARPLESSYSTSSFAFFTRRRSFL